MTAPKLDYPDIHEYVALVREFLDCIRSGYDGPFGSPFEAPPNDEALLFEELDRATLRLSRMRGRTFSGE